MYSTREQWLLAAVDKLRPLFESHQLTIPKKLKVSCGFPGTGNRRKTTGECWPPNEDQGRAYVNIFVSPMLAEETSKSGVLNTLAHECLHASLPKGTKHKGPFKEAMQRLGMEGKAPSSTSGSELIERFKTIVKEIGPYPHRSLALPGKDGGEKKQTTRMLKVTCSCGLTIRVTQKWLAQGQPKCWLCGSGMSAEGGGSGEEGEGE